MLRAVGTGLKSAVEAIPGHRVIINKNCAAGELHGASATVLEHPQIKRDLALPTSDVYIKLDEPYATRWGNAQVFVWYSSLNHAPSYDELVAELADVLSEKETLEATVRIKTRELTAEQARHEATSAQVGKLEAQLADATAKLSPLEEWERSLLADPAPRTFRYRVKSTTTPGTWYTIMVRNNEVVECDCLGWHFRGCCKHADYFSIPAEAWEDARRYRSEVGELKAQSVLREIAKLAGPFA